MKRIIAVALIFILSLSVLFVPASAAGESVNPDTGDLFGLVIAMLLTSAMGVAVLVAHKTRFDHEDHKKAGE